MDKQEIQNMYFHIQELGAALSRQVLLVKDLPEENKPRIIELAQELRDLGTKGKQEGTRDTQILAQLSDAFEEISKLTKGVSDKTLKGIVDNIGRMYKILR